MSVASPSRTSTEDTPSGPEPSSDSTLTPRRSSSSLDRFWRGPVEDAPWVRPAVLALLVATAVLYLWGLGASGWANSFYSAAVQAGSESWKAFFFGSSDAANSITVDKPPLALWVMDLSVRVFGLSSWSILVPQALMGVGSVALLYGTVRRSVASAGAGLLAGAILALTPVAALMFRFNNPDAALVLLLIGSVAATMRAVEATSSTQVDSGRIPAAVRWLALAGALVGLAFLAKMLQAFLVLPGLGAVYLLAADTSLARRVKHLLVAFAAMLVTAGWWVAIVALWPASSRPYIGGSEHNSILELTFGYNGLGRITGSETGSVGGGGGWGATGWLRLLNSEIGGQIGWLLPASVLLLAAGAWFTRKSGRTDLTRAALVAWGGWLLVTAATFSFMSGIFHAYYTVALAPAVGAIVAIGATVLWRRRDEYAAALVLAGAVASTSSFGFFLLNRTPGYDAWLKWAVLVVGIGAALLIAVVRHVPQRVGQTAVAGALVASLAGPAAYTLTTVSTPHTGSIPTAGPTVAGAGFGAMGGAPMGAVRFGGITGRLPDGTTGQFPGGPTGGFPGGPTGGFPGGMTGGTGSASVGGLLDGSTSSAKVTALLEANASDYTWVAAAVGSNTAAGFQLASQQPVMPIGGFNGSDPSPSLAAFRALVAKGEIHYFIGTGSLARSATGTGQPGRAAAGGRRTLIPGGPTAGGSTSTQISTWVAHHFTAKTVDGVTLYDLSDVAK